MSEFFPDPNEHADDQEDQTKFPQEMVHATALDPSDCCAFNFARTRKMGLTGLEPVTLRLSSACSNQLSYRPGEPSSQFEISNFKFEISSWWS